MGERPVESGGAQPRTLDIRLFLPSPVLTGEEGPAAKRWEVRVCTAESARPSPPKPSAWVPPLPRKPGEELAHRSAPAQEATELGLEGGGLVPHDGVAAAVDPDQSGAGAAGISGGVDPAH